MQKTVLITGGAQGIGRAVAVRFAAAGYGVSVSDVNKEAGLELIRHIRQMDGKGMFVCADTADPDAMKRWISLSAEDFGRVDVLVNNAGIGNSAPVLELSLEAFDRVLAVGLRGTFVCSQLAATYMAQQKKGAIINIASTRALMSEANTEAYAASKGGIVALTHAMAVSLGPLGVRVNAISPGWIETSDWQQLSKSKAPQHSERDRLQHPVGRVGVPDDIAAACIYLAGEEAGFITGQNFVIDGGMTVKMIYEP